MHGLSSEARCHIQFSVTKSSSWKIKDTNETYLQEEFQYQQNNQYSMNSSLSSPLDTSNNNSDNGNNSRSNRMMNLSSSRNLRQSLAAGRGGRRLVSADSTLAANYTNTGLRYERQGEYSQALVYYEKALQLSMSSKGADHPDVIRILSDIADMNKAIQQQASSSASGASASGTPILTDRDKIRERAQQRLGNLATEGMGSWTQEDDERRLVSLRMKKSPLPSSASTASTAAAQIDQSEQTQKLNNQPLKKRTSIKDILKNKGHLSKDV